MLNHNTLEYRFSGITLACASTSLSMTVTLSEVEMRKYFLKNCYNSPVTLVLILLMLSIHQRMAL